jgi:co-chaperonin GroES (HSP10)
MALTRPRAAQIYDIDYKQATRVVTVANITLAGGAPSSVDGVNLSLNDRVLVTGQSTLSQNGIYYVTIVGSGSNGTWSRSLDTNNTGEILTGTVVMVTEGIIYADTQWKLITDGIIDVGVTDQVWTQNYSANSISSGNSNVIVNSNANVTISSAGVPTDDTVTEGSFSPQ